MRINPHQHWSAEDSGRGMSHGAADRPRPTSGGFPALRMTSSLRSSGNLGWGFIGSSHLYSRSQRFPHSLTAAWAGRVGALPGAATRSRFLHRVPDHAFHNPIQTLPHSNFAFRGGPLRGEQPTTEGVVNVRFQGGEVRSV